MAWNRLTVSSESGWEYAEWWNTMALEYKCNVSPLKDIWEQSQPHIGTTT